MKTWSKLHTWVVGTAVILLANAVALGSVAWNRSGTPESVLKLSQRELRQPYWRVNAENSGLALELQWRYPVAPAQGTRPASWLDSAKMRSLGFEVGGEDGKAPARPVLRQLSNPVFLVLELDGPAYRQALEFAQRRLAEAQAKLAADPDKEPLKRAAANAKAAAEEEAGGSSRLFAIDAGLELAALRAQYPERSRYAIVAAQAHPYGSVSAEVSINVPFALRAGFERKRPPPVPSLKTQARPFEATVAFGRHLEPWILDIGMTPP